MGAGCTLEIVMYHFWCYNDVYHQNYQCQNLHPLVALPLSIIYCPLTPPLIKCCEFPRCDPFLKLSLNCNYLGYLDMLIAALYPCQVAFESKPIIRLICFCILQPSQVKSLVMEIVVQGDFFNWASPGFAKCWTVSNSENKDPEI